MFRQVRMGWQKEIIFLNYISSYFFLSSVTGKTALAFFRVSKRFLNEGVALVLPLLFRKEAKDMWENAFIKTFS